MYSRLLKIVRLSRGSEMLYGRIIMVDEEEAVDKSVHCMLIVLQGHI